jgi:glycosyltransferase involved in cell wall biosynthesis
MKVVIVSAYFPPRPSAGGNRLASFARGLRAQGVDVTVFAPWFDDDSLIPSDRDLTDIVCWTPAKSVNRGGFVRRFYDEALIAWSLIGRARKVDCDAFLVTTPFLSLVLLSGIMIRSSKLIIDIRDLSWKYSVSRNPISQLFLRVLGRFVIYVLHRAAMIITSTESELLYVEKLQLNAKCALVSNGIEDSFIRSMEMLDPMTQRGGGEVAYVGTVGRAQGASILVDAAKNLPNLMFRIAGDGDEFLKIKKLVYEDGITNVEVLGWISRLETYGLYSKSDVLFCRLRPGFASAVPSKVYEYAAVGRSIVYMGDAGDAAWSKLREFDGTYLVKNGDLDDLVATLEKAVARPRPNADYNRAILRNRYTREVQARNLAKLITDFIKIKKF